MFTGRKIRNLAKAKGVHMKALAAAAGFHETSFSRKINSEDEFDNNTLLKIGAFLGLDPDYIRDKTRPFNIGDAIPPDAILAKTPPAKPTPDTDPVAALMILAQKQMQETRNELAQIDPEIMLQANREMIDAMNRLAVEMRELSQELRLTREGEPGEHHPD